MKKLIALSVMLVSLSSFAIMPPMGGMICGTIERDFDTTLLFTTRGIYELTTYDHMAQLMLDGYYTGDKCCVAGDVYGDGEIIVDKVIPSIGL